jgi:hypothetical protein
MYDPGQLRGLYGHEVALLVNLAIERLRPLIAGGIPVARVPAHPAVRARFSMLAMPPPPLQIDRLCPRCRRLGVISGGGAAAPAPGFKASQDITFEELGVASDLEVVRCGVYLANGTSLCQAAGVREETESLAMVR